MFTVLAKDNGEPRCLVIVVCPKCGNDIREYEATVSESAKHRVKDGIAVIVDSRGCACTK